MDQVPQRLTGWWRGLDAGERRRVSALAAISVVYIIHYLVFCIPQSFFIEDSGITFAYSRNLVQGDGLVPYPGGERVEGYSNPTWTFLLAALYALGVEPWSSAKILGAVFGVVTLPLAYGLVRRARPATGDAERPLADVALLAPLMLALNPQFVIWNASGLENSLFCVLLAAGLYQLVVEAEDDGRGPFPWSALWFTLLGMTRPEGITYGLLAFGASLVTAIQRRSPLRLMGWLVVFLAPFAAYQAWRYSYFAWEFPNTYYAKEAGEKAFQPFSWTVRGWKYIKNYLMTTGMVAALPILVIGLVGLGRKGRRWPLWTGLGLVAVLTVLIAWDGREGLPGTPSWWRPVVGIWIKARVWGIAVGAALVGVLTLLSADSVSREPGVERLRPGWRARGLLVACCSASIFFVLYAGGDWMKSFRWFNLVSVTLIPLIAISLGEIADGLPGLVRRLPLPARFQGEIWAPLLTGRNVLLAVPFTAYTVISIIRSNAFAIDPETSVRDVRRRVDYMTWVQKRLDIDHVTLLDVDMGAHMYFSGWDIVDIAGLIDVPIARHRDYDKKFMAEYIFGERNPEFAHVHAGWARTSKIPTHREWTERYLEIPGFPTGGLTLHVGNHVRRDLFIDDRRPVDEPLARFAGSVKLVSVDVPSPLVAPGGELFVHTAWQSDYREDGFRILAVLESKGADGRYTRTVSALPPGYDWYRPEDWKADEVVHGRQRVTIPEGLPPGEYTLSLVVLDEKSGEVLRALQPGEADPSPPPPPPQPKFPKKGKDAKDTKDGKDEAAEVSEEAVAPVAEEAPAAEAPVATPPAPVPPAEEATAYLAGGWRVPVKITVASVDEAVAAATADLEAATEATQRDACEAAWDAWKNATRHVMRNVAWQDRNEPDLRTSIADCYVRRAEKASTEDQKASALVTARRYDFRYGPLVEAASALAETYEARGDGLAASEDWEGAYDAYHQALLLDPQRAWARRKAEDARDRRLGIGAYKPAPRAAPKPVKPTKAVLDKARENEGGGDMENVPPGLPPPGGGP